MIARELGFSSWPTLKVAVDAATAAPDDRAQAFLAASIEGRAREAARLLQADPGVAGRSLRAAVVLGETGSVRAHLAADPEAALAVDDERTPPRARGQAPPSGRAHAGLAGHRQGSAAPPYQPT